jgi:ankyrin repeat protein
MRRGLSEGEALLFECCASGDEEKFTAWLESQPQTSLSACNALGMTALHETTSAAIARVLVKSIAPSTASLMSGETPLHAAAAKGLAEVLAVLIEHCEEIDILDDDGRSPLHVACERGHVGCARILLEKEANCDLKSKRSLTPLLEAVKSGSIELVTLLVNYADLSACDSNGRNSLHLAVISQNENMVAFLLEVDPELATEQDVAEMRAEDYDQTDQMRALFGKEEPTPEETKEKKTRPKESVARDIKQVSHPFNVSHATGQIYQMKLFEDETLDFQGSASGSGPSQLEIQVNQFLAQSKCVVVSQSIACIAIPSTSSKQPGRIKRTFSLVYYV